MICNHGFNSVICNDKYKEINWDIEELNCNVETEDDQHHNQSRKSSFEDKNNDSPFKNKGQIKMSDRDELLAQISLSYNMRKKSYDYNDHSRFISNSISSEFKTSKEVPRIKEPRKKSYPMMEDIKFLLGELRKAKAKNENKKSPLSPEVIVPNSALVRDCDCLVQNEYILTMKDIDPLT